MTGLSRGSPPWSGTARTSARRDSSLAGCVDDVRGRRPIVEHDVPARTADEDIVAALALQDVWAVTPGDAGIVPGRSIENRGPVLTGVGVARILREGRSPRPGEEEQGEDGSECEPDHRGRYEAIPFPHDPFHDSSLRCML